MQHKDFTIICGHYGCGKTNLSINLALDAAASGRRTVLVDFDIVNPYFRSSDYVGLLREKGVRLIAPAYARSTIDLPMLPPEVHSIFGSSDVVIVDVGGDDAGATVLGSFSDRLQGRDYDMLYVVNKHRPLSATATLSLALLREVERASHLKATAIVNNSHLMQDSTAETILGASAFAEETSVAAGLPLRATVVPRFLAGCVGEALAGDTYYVDIYVRPPWTEPGVP